MTSATAVPRQAATGSRDLRVARPRVLAARRSDLSTYAVGDEAVIEFGPGLLRFLGLRPEDGDALGEGGAFEWTIPVGAAGTAAYAVVEPEGFDGVNTWTGVTNEIRWRRACRPDETLIATCRLAGLGRAARLPYRTYSLERGDLVVEGEFVFVAVASDAQGLYVIEPRRRPDAPVPPRQGSAGRVATRGQRPAPAAEPATAVPVDPEGWARLPLWTAAAPPRWQAPEPPAPDLFSLRAPRVLRRYRDEAGADTWDWLFPRDLLRLLGHPIAGSTEPLGRRHHPYGRILEGMAVHAARAMSRDQIPRELAIEWWSPTAGTEDFRIRSTRLADDAAGVTTEHAVYEGERAVGTVRVLTGPGPEAA